VKDGLTPTRMTDRLFGAELENDFNWHLRVSKSRFPLAIAVKELARMEVELIDTFATTSSENLKLVRKQVSGQFGFPPIFHRMRTKLDLSLGTLQRPDDYSAIHTARTEFRHDSTTLSVRPNSTNSILVHCAQLRIILNLPFEIHLLEHV